MYEVVHNNNIKFDIIISFYLKVLGTCSSEYLSDKKYINSFKMFIIPVISYTLPKEKRTKFTKRKRKYKR